MPKRPELHPACAAFPELPQEELNALSADIKEHGLIEPITLYNGLLLDGRCRWDACALAGVKVRTVEYDGAAPIAFVISKNQHRRHMNTAQRALTLARIAVPTVNQHDKKEPRLGKSGQSESYTIEQLATISKLSGSAIRRGRHVLQNAAPHIIKMIDDGKAINIYYAAEATRKFNKTIQSTWTTPEEVDKAGSAIVKSYPSIKSRTVISTEKNKAKAHAETLKPSPAKKAANSTKKTVNMPFLQPLTKEEIGAPSFKDDPHAHGKHLEKYGRTQLHPKDGKDLLDCAHLVKPLFGNIRQLSKFDTDGVTFFESLDMMLKWVPDPKSKHPSLKIDHAKDAKPIAAQLDEMMPKVYELVQSLYLTWQARQKIKPK